MILDTHEAVVYHNPAIEKTQLKRLVFLLHGYGATPHSFIQLAPFFEKHLPGTLWVALRAPLALRGGGYGWFSLERIDLNTPDFAQESQAIYQAVQTIESCVQKCLQNIPHLKDKISLLGFSQGAAMAIYTGLYSKLSLQSVVGYAGFWLGGKNFSAKVVSPVCLVHGQADEVVPVSACHFMAHQLRSLGYAGHMLKVHLIEDLQHSLDPVAVMYGAEFILRSEETLSIPNKEMPQTIK